MFEGHHYQNAYVTRDIEKAIEAFQARADVRKLLRYEGTTKVVTPAGAGEQTCKLAFIWVGDMQYEFIQPVSGAVGIYSDALPDDDALTFHHICTRVKDWDDFRARVDQQSYPVVLEGGGDALKFIYLDARETVGHYLEFCWMNDQRWGQMGGE